MLASMEIPLINKTYEAYKALIDINLHLEKQWRYTLGYKCEGNILALMEQLIMAKYAPKNLKGAYLLKATAFLEILRLELRLMLEFKAVKNETNIFKLQAALEEIGRMLGGWLRSLEK